MTQQQKPVLVVGATGQLGTEIVRLGLKLGHRIRALLRSSEDKARFAGLEGQSLEFAIGTLTDQASLQEACRGVGSIISTANAMGGKPRAGDSVQSVDRLGQLALIGEAERAGVEHFTYLSFPPIDDITFALQDAKRDVERRLQSSKLGWTVLQATNFMEFWLHPLRGLDARGGTAVVFGKGDKPVSWISIHDVARFAVAAAGAPSFRGQTLVLGGPDALSQRQVLAIFEELGAPSFKVQEVPEEFLKGGLEAARVEKNDLAEAQAAIPLGTSRGLRVPHGAAQSFLPGKMLTVRDYATALLGEHK